MQIKDKISAGFLIIGDEILSGRTIDLNLNFLAKNLSELGINLNEVRVVRDVEEEIVKAVKDLSLRYDYVFTSGGIGPTHDDITSASIAKAFDDQLILNTTAKEILFNYYGSENVNDARLKMAYIPSTATLLDNPISSAPGFCIKNVFVMAGIPKIFQAMFESSKKKLTFGKKLLTKEIVINLTESVIAKEFGDLQLQYPQVIMGSYPFDGGTSLVFRSTNKNILEISTNQMLIIIDGINPKSIIKIS